MKRKLSLLVTGLIAAGLVLWPTVASAKGVGAGTLIENTASATYDAGDGPETLNSNTVTVKVDELLDVAVSSLDSGPVGTDPGSGVLTFEVTNKGNGPEAFVLTANPSIGGNDFDTTIGAIAVDTNGNGVYDPGIDQILTGPETTPVLYPEDIVTVFVLVTVPAIVADGEKTTVDLRADAVTGTGAPGTVFAGQGVDSSDAIVGASGAFDTASGSLIVGITTVDLVKSAITVDPFGGTSAVPGSIITYTITASVSGSGSVSGLVVSDAIPSGTTYRTGTLTLDTIPTTDAAGDDAGEASATGILVDLGIVPGGSSHTVTFEVGID